MNSMPHLAKQATFAERVSKALASVPADKRPMLEAVVESALIGASIAASPTPPTFPLPPGGLVGGTVPAAHTAP